MIAHDQDYFLLEQYTENSAIRAAAVIFFNLAWYIPFLWLKKSVLWTEIIVNRRNN